MLKTLVQIQHKTTGRTGKTFKHGKVGKNKSQIRTSFTKQKS